MIFVIAEPGFPVPRFKVIAKLTEITLEATGQLVVVACDLIGPQPCFQSTVTDAGREPRSGRHSTYLTLRNGRVRSSWGRVIRHREWIERILNRHADARGTYSKGVKCIREYVRHKSSGPQGAVKETAHVFEVTKKLQVLLANFGLERAVEVFTVHRGHCRCESGEVKKLLPPRQTKPRHILRVVLYVWERVWCWGQRVVIELWLVNKVSDAPSKIGRPKITTSKKWRSVDVRRNVAVAAVDGVATVPLSVNNNICLVVTDASQHVR